MHINSIKPYVLILASLVTGTSWAAVSPAEAERLKDELTPFGAERAGNAAGTIPAWTGGIAEEQGYKSGSRPDPFAGEKPLYVIDASNMAQYRDQLSDGQVELLQKFPSYKMEVY